MGKKKLLEILNKNKNKKLNRISIGSDYINIYYFENSKQIELINENDYLEI